MGDTQRPSVDAKPTAVIAPAPQPLASRAAEVAAAAAAIMPSRQVAAAAAAIMPSRQQAMQAAAAIMRRRPGDGVGDIGWCGCVDRGANAYTVGAHGRA
jgi:hypothetical protein